MFELGAERVSYIVQVGPPCGQACGCDGTRVMDPVWVCKSSGFLNLEAAVTMW